MSREELPVVLTKWYDYTKWVLDRVEGLPKNQRFVLGTRLADAVLEVRIQRKTFGSAFVIFVAFCKKSSSPPPCSPWASW